MYSGRAAALTSASDDKLGPCQISWEYTDAYLTDRLREKAVHTAIEAVQRIDEYGERADFVREKFEADEGGDWCCHAQHKETVS